MGGFFVETCDSPGDLPTELINRAKAENLPDLLVLDLYHTNATPGSREAERTNEAVDDAVAKVMRAVADLKVIVDKEKSPLAVSVLERLREIDGLKELPVLIYTRQGLALLDDATVGKIYQLGADWMPKGREGHVERLRMGTFVQRAQESGWVSEFLQREGRKRGRLWYVLGTVTTLILTALALIKGCGS